MPQPSDHNEQSPCVALLTPPGRGAVAAVGVWGGGATEAVSRRFSAASGRPLVQMPLRRVVFGRWVETNEELVVCRLEEDHVEIYCHGGQAAAESIVGALVSAGCRAADWRQWPPPQESDALAADAVAALADARTERTAAILMDQYRGALRSELLAVVGEVTAGRAAEAIGRLDMLQSRGEVGRRLTCGWRVVLSGPPNVGKSSLINAIVGYRRSIVVDRPGTTRDVVTAATAIDGWPVELADTAGLRETGDALESAGVARAREATTNADVIVLVREAGQPLSADQQTPPAGKPTVFVKNKCDLVSSQRARTGVAAAEIATCALSGEGVASLITAISAAMVPDAPPAGAAVPFTEKHTDAIREARSVLANGDSEAAAVALGELLDECKSGRC